ncbi:MAG: valine--tRNA ligase [Maricaulaceae bacterium]|nr:valine--tRNA ligase [Maricaulaceae bacterium]
MLDKTFDPKSAEGRIYAMWEEAGAFQPKDDPKADPFCIVIPPPNVTGRLHIGHALNNTLQDVLARYHRMLGKAVLWQPGTDHAGIATQMVVERQLAEEGNISRRDMGRDAFIERVWKWKEESGGMILSQLRRLGASCDWSRERFTLDDGLSRAVLKVFVELHRQGLIYRDKRLVNWDPHFQTAISDLEVENREVKGHFWYLKYPLADGATYRFPVAFDDDGNATEWEQRDHIVVGTTRPETMLGDTAVAVHPEDERYKDLIGKTVRLPIADVEIPVIADEHADPALGDGAVKITPAHDFNDFAVYERHRDIGLVNIFDREARYLASAGTHESVEFGVERIPVELRGLDRFTAREKIVARMEELGLLKAIEDRVIMVPYGDRSNAVIEPYLTDQWFVKADVLAREAIAAVEDGRTAFHPKNWEKTYFEWMRNIQPWCVSRQLWWGHRIPAWYGPDMQDLRDGDQLIRHALIGSARPFVGESYEAARQIAEEYYGQEVRLLSTWEEYFQAVEQFATGGDVGPVPMVQDPDVLDTWFSSALWPFSTLGWPDETPELKRFYPTSVLVTAFDIIFFWVARMMMQGLHFMKDGAGRPLVPFRDVYIHALVRDEKGQKMSKSKGNVIDPLELVDEFGADAVRFTLAALAAQGRDIRMSKGRVEGYRNFGTKLWNAARFCLMNECRPDPAFDPKGARQTVNRWILGEAETAVKAVAAGLESYRFNEAAAAAYRFVWNVFCDWHLEFAKPLLSGDDEAAKAETRAATAFVLESALKLLHPFMPFVTEELWEKTAGPEGRGGLLITAPWPALDGLRDSAAAEEMDWVVRLVTEARSVRAEMNVPPALQVKGVLVGGERGGGKQVEWVVRHGALIRRLARMESLEIADVPPPGSAQVVVDGAVLALPLAGVIDIGTETARLIKEIKRLDGEIARLDGKLGNERFVASAPEAVVEAEREKRSDYNTEREKLHAALQRLEQAG